MCDNSSRIHLKLKEVELTLFSQRTVKHWNSLPEHVDSASSVNCFKNRLDPCTERT